METTLEIKNKVASIHIAAIIALNMSGEVSLLSQSMESAFSKDEIEILSATGIDFIGKTTKEALLLVRDWLTEVKVAKTSK